MGEEIVLVVDDSRQTADFVSKNILPSLGYSALTAYGGTQALELLKEKHKQISLMLLDLQMPGMSGLELLNATKEEGMNIPAIMITAHGSEDIVKDAFRLGVYDYLKKPVDIDKLDAAISRALSETRLRAETDKLTKQLQNQVSWLTALSDVGRSVTSTLNISTVLRIILEASVSLSQAEQGFIALKEPNTDRLYLRAVKNIETKRIDTVRLPVNDPLFKQAFETGNPVRKTRSDRTDVLKVSTGLLVYSLIHVPILYQGNPVGILSMNNHSLRRNFTENDEQVLISLADYAGIAIGNANSFDKVRLEIEERKRIEAALRESEERYALAVQGSNDGIWDWDLKTNRVYYSPRWKEMLGLINENIGDNPDEWFSRIYKDDLDHTLRDISTHIHKKTSHFINEHRIHHNNGTERWMLCRGIAVWNEENEATRLAGSMSDITAQKIAEERLLHDALHDALTGLPNRVLFMDRLNQTLERSKRNDEYQFAVLFLDLDNFKDVNDSIGHLVGDQLLIKVADTLLKGLRSIDTLARFGGDEFIILLDDIQDINGVARVTDWIKEQFRNPIKVAGHEVITSTSIGIILSDPNLTSAEEVIRNADIAMYAAKDRGKSRAEIFDPSMRQRFLDRLETETDLRKAVGNNELRVYFQPIVIMESGKLVGFEALARWEHPVKGLLIPADFISIAEETGLIIEIDKWMLQEACSQVALWNRKYQLDEELTISVNISGKHITRPDLQNYIQYVLDDTKLNPKNLKLEITELSIVDQNEITARSLANIQRMGIQIQIDDFGIGYSSLSYLSRFPINALKIDKSFVSRILEESSQRDIIQAIVTLTNSLKANVIAEGVETLEQSTELIGMGCEMGQGHHFSFPVDSEKIEDMLKSLIENNGGLPN